MLSKSFGTGLFFVWNDTKFVLLLFIDNLLATHQWYSLWKSYFARSITSSKFGTFDNKEASSANNLTALHPTALYISLMYNKKINGPRTDPWGTPHFTMPISDCTPLTTVNWRLLVKYDMHALGYHNSLIFSTLFHDQQYENPSWMRWISQLHNFLHQGDVWYCR